MSRQSPIILLILFLGFFHGQAACASATAAIQQDGTAQSVSFLFDPPSIPYPVVHASINGSAPLNLLVDTGAGAGLLLTPAGAEVAKLDPTTAKSDVQRGGSGAPIASEAYNGAIHSLIIGDAGNTVDLACTKADVLPLLSLASSKGVRVEGIIGAPIIFRKQCVTFDYAAKTMTFWSGRPVDLEKDAGAHYSLVRYSSKCFLAVGSGGRLVNGILLDTGAERTMLPNSTRDDLHIEEYGKMNAMRLDGGSILVDRCRASGSVGPFGLSHFPVAFVHEDEFSPEIGSDMLSQYKITIDVDQSMLYVKNGVANKAAIGDGCSGCVVAMSNDHVAAAEIDPTSPADIAGIKVGDRILAIDGQNMDGELPGAIQGLLDGAIGQKSDVTVVGADGKQRTCTLVRVSGFKRVEPGAGISLSWLPNKPLYVSHLEPDCTGERAGLRIGDEVVGLNGQKHSFTSQYIKYALSASTVDITVVRGDHELTCHLTTAPNTPLGK